MPFNNMILLKSFKGPIIFLFLFLPMMLKAQFPPPIPIPLVNDIIVHEGDLILSGSDNLEIINTEYIVKGNVYLSGDACLVLRQSVLRITHYPRQELFINDNASLVADTSIFSDLVHAFLNNSSEITLNNCLFINLLQVDGQAKATINDSHIFSEPFGLLQPGEEAEVYVNNSVIGAIGLGLPEYLTYDIIGLAPGFFDYWSVQEAISPGLSYSLVMNYSEVRDNPGYSGGYEMGWNLMTGSNCDLNISNSVLNKLVISFSNEDVTFSGLLTREPVDFSYKDIVLVNTTIQNLWGIFVDNGETIITDSEGIWLWPVGNKNTTVVGSLVNEFDPREFTGNVTMEECAMNNGFEIYANCDLRLQGGIRMNETEPLWDQNSLLTRNYPVQLFNDMTGDPWAAIALALEKDGEVLWRDTSDMDGRVDFDITFGFNNHNDHWHLKSEDSLIWLDKDIGIRSFTPHLIRLEPADDSIHYMQVVYVDSSNPSGGTGISNDPFRKIQEGIDHCSRKGTVKVSPGIYSCGVNLADEVFLSGAGPDSTFIENDVFAWDIQGARISGFTIDDGQTAGIHCYGSAVEITNNVVRGQPHHGVLCSGSDLTLINNTIDGNGLCGIFIVDTSSCEARNNIISNNGLTGLFCDQPEFVAVGYNDLWNNAEGNYGPGIDPGEGDIFTDPMFIDESSGDFRLQGSSPCIDAGDPDPAYNDPGGSRNDMGAYGGPVSSLPGQTLQIFEPTPAGNIILSQNHPNPFTGETTISYYLPEKVYLSLGIYDLFGLEIKVLFEGMHEKGIHFTTWNGTGTSGRRVGGGIYIYQLFTLKGRLTGKMILIAR